MLNLSQGFCKKTQYPKKKEDILQNWLSRKYDLLKMPLKAKLPTNGTLPADYGIAVIIRFAVFSSE